MAFSSFIDSPSLISETPMTYIYLNSNRSAFLIKSCQEESSRVVV